jgi:hypothetical protein
VHFLHSIEVLGFSKACQRTLLSLVKFDGICQAKPGFFSFEFCYVVTLETIHKRNQPNLTTDQGKLEKFKNPAMLSNSLFGDTSIMPNKSER